MKRLTIISILVFLTTAVAQGQIKIGGNVYGGGNKGNVDGSTKVTVYKGDLNKVFGGARMANVGGNAYVNIDGKNASGYMVINYLFGGNDIAGNIGTAAAVNETLPPELLDSETGANPDGVTTSWNTYVHISTKTETVEGKVQEAADAKKAFIGQLYAGGNGDYYYNETGRTTTGSGENAVTKVTYDVYNSEEDFTGTPKKDPIATITTNGNTPEPELDKTYIDIQGATIAYAYGGGNNATVREETIIHLDNPSTVVTNIYVNSNAEEVSETADGATDLLSDDRQLNLMGINTALEQVASDRFQIGRLFGGNNKAEMSIMPTWNLQIGKVRNLYSGGNQGSMTSKCGLLLKIDPAKDDDLEIDNVYGGCRMADVRPLRSGTLKNSPVDSYASDIKLAGYHFPDGLAARVLVYGGKINNVYGGNDVRGKVYGGNALGIYSSILGDVYGGGNGSYAYTDNPRLRNTLEYGDYYYDKGSNSVEALNANRPNAEQVSIRVLGDDADHPTIIGGAIYCGGNSATLHNSSSKAMVHVKIGSHVIADKVFLGNNGEHMVEEDVLKYYAGSVTVDNTEYKFSELDMTDANVFKTYMDGVSLSLIPDVVSDDVTTYIPYSTKIGSLYLGGNVGSMTYPGTNTMDFDVPFIIYNKVVGGCNDAYVPQSQYNAAYMGGILGSSEETKFTTANDEVKNRLVLNFGTEFGAIKIQPKRWKMQRDNNYVIKKDDEGNELYELDPNGNRQLEWNTVHADLDDNLNIVEINPDPSQDGNIADGDRRLFGGNVYGGCYNSGTVNGNVVININRDLVVRDEVFATPKMKTVTDPETNESEQVEEVDSEGRQIIDTSSPTTKPINSGVLRFEQGDDVLGAAMNVFGSGYGAMSKILGNTTINMNGGYAFQLFGGGEMGTVNKYEYATTGEGEGATPGTATVAESGNTIVNLNGGEVEYLYGGGFEGDIDGHTLVNLGDGTCYDALGGACNANVEGYTEVYIGRNGDGTPGFPTILDCVFGGNDFGGKVLGTKTHSIERNRTVYNASLLTSNTYVEYIRGRVDSIFGGNFGYYEYADSHYKKYTYSKVESASSSHKPGDPRDGFIKPFITNSFVYFNPANDEDNSVGIVLGGSQGSPNEVTNNNSMQEKSYVLVDDNSGSENFKLTDVFGAGAYGGLGTPQFNGVGQSVIDLFQGHLHNVYGASNREGLVGSTRINVPSVSTIHVNALFGGGKGYEIERINNANDTEARTSTYCDTYVSCIDYQGVNAYVDDAIYGGNHNCRITCDTYINIGVPVKRDDVGNYAKVYGAGYGSNTVAGRTNVYMNNGSIVNEVYGGGRDGNAYNFATLTQWLFKQYTLDNQSTSTAAENVQNYASLLDGASLYISGREADEQTGDTELVAHPINLPSPMPAYVDNIRTGNYYNTNVHIMKGALVKTNATRDADGLNGGYAYGGGHGSEASVAGTTYIELKGGTVDKDIYGAGWGGPVYDKYKLAADADTSNDFVAATNVYVEGGTCRNVYGGGYQGAVGYHEGGITAGFSDDVLAETNVTIGKLNGTSFIDGIPAIQRNAYAGGEGGAVWGTGNITVNNGYIGYIFNAAGTDLATTAFDERYEENIIDYTWKDDQGNFIPNTNLYDSGCIFGGGYVDNSSVDFTNVYMYGGQVRNSLFGGGEIAAIGRGTIHASGDKNSVRTLEGIYKGGKTFIEMYGGHVHRNVFGGGRGYNNLGKQGTLYSDGYVFGQTDVHIHGGEIGSVKELALGNGNVFGGGDIGYVYSAYQNAAGNLCFGKKSGTRYDDGDEGYYYKYENNAYLTVGTGSEKVPTEDCKVLIEPHCKVTGSAGVEFTDIYYPKESRLSTEDMEYLRKNYSSLMSGIDANGKVTADDGIKFNRTFAPGEYVPTYALNTLKNKTADTRWNSLDPTGIIIYNAVFAGGNTSSGSAAVYANATSVYGNVTASIHDVYHRDLVTLGTGHTGGLYGDGNLTFVDGYRGLNITNYGTDYYFISKEIDIDTYHALPDREAAYYELKYKCLLDCTDKDGTRYSKGGGNTNASTITADDLLTLFVEDDGTSVRVDGDGKRVTAAGEGTPVLKKDTEGKWVPNISADTGKPIFWEENGVLPIYAGRLMNSIQRADFCGVFGSRMVLQGAQDRVPEIVDFTNYTINRVREVSLNQQHTVIDDDKNISQDSEDYEKKTVHGNYFGIYNIVNYLGALTSDVHFMPTEDVRRTTNTSNSKFKDPIKIGDNTYNYGSTGATYYNWKQANIKNNTRNNGSSYNKVALASGVYLELTTEKSTGKELNEKDWGYITGVIELDLINVQPGIGGGFVYAKNEHRLSHYSPKQHSTLTALNADAITRKDFTYTANSEVEWETSGNFIHSTQTIIDDCYNISGRYKGTSAVPAHYWYIKGSVYVYDQYISAYTGSPNAYSEKVEIPLTITAASHGSMKLLNVQPNLYAFNSSPGVPMEQGKKIVINDVTYYKNDPISYWDWYMLSKSERELFVEKTYVTIADCKIGDKIYPEGYSMLPSEYEALRNSASAQTIDGEEGVKAVVSLTKDEEGNYQVVTDDKGRYVYKAFDFVFRESNNLSHDEGYILTYKVNNPTEWDTWYTEKIDAEHNQNVAREKQQAMADGYENGPTYRLISSTGGVLGQRNYSVGEMISNDVYNTYQSIKSNITESDGVQATFVPGYIVTEDLTYTETITETVGEGDQAQEVTRTETHHYNPGAAVPKKVADANTSSTSPAYISTSTIHLSETDYIYLNAKMSLIEKNKYITDINTQITAINNDNTLTTAEKTEKVTKLQALKAEIDEKVVPAYYCTEAGLYGGNYYTSGKNYRGLDAWSAMSETDRQKFTFNYDALDLLIDPAYSNKEGKKYQYDGATYDAENGTFVPFSTEDQAQTNPAGYSVTKPVDYTATYNSDTDLALKDSQGNAINIKVKRGTDTGYSTTTSTLKKEDELSRTVYESLTNEQRNYVPVTMVKEGEGEATKYKAYVVNTPFQIGNTPHAVGNVISAEEYNSLGDNKGCITVLEYPYSAGDAPIFYYCRESYQVGENGNGVEVAAAQNVTASIVTGEGATASSKSVTVSGTYNADSDKVPVGLVINNSYYSQLVDKNQQKNFTIHGISPTETSTFYVSRNSDIFDLSTEKIITVVYQYDYEEVDDKGGVTPISERHVLNIHINFKSGVPTVGNIDPPKKVLPGDVISIKEPAVSEGAYEVTGGGWELFESKGDAESHVNGVEFKQDFDQLYWYQDGYWIAYYAKTYLGKTYSNAVQVGVANYHDLKDVMADTKHHYYVDRPDVARDSKIYIKDYKVVDENGQETADSKNGLDLLKDFYDLSLLTTAPASGSTLEGHSTLDSHVRAGRNLEFFLRADQDHTGKEWVPIGNNSTTECFEGMLHGDGYTIRGLDHSLFKSLCGDVYNLGVMGNFVSTGDDAADAGIAEDGSGYVENCWVSNVNAGAKHSKPIFNSPSRTADEIAAKGAFQIVNCYYEEDDNAATPYTNHDASSAYGVPTRKTSQAFNNGEVAFDLNGFYLYKRYSDHEVTSGTNPYMFYTVQSEDKLSDPTVAYYRTGDGNLCSSSATETGYVENRFADGDYRYAGGFIPEGDVRTYVDKNNDDKLEFYPIWPDDYLFFGQMLTYGYDEDLHPHEDHPSHLVKDGNGRLLSTDMTNRVYRAPAYYRSYEMGVAHYNPWANVAATSSDGKKVYPNMTAIDFTGYNDSDRGYAYQKGMANWSKTSQQAQSTGNMSDKEFFYPPLLDNDGLIGFANRNETKNLLVYVPLLDAAVPSSKTNTAVNKYVSDPLYSDYYSRTDDDPQHVYKTVAQMTSTVSFHIVEKTADSQKPYMSYTDHYLVDKQDFNAPMAYTFDGGNDGHRMWYQRKPDDIANYVGKLKNADGSYKLNAGWEDVSLPFTAELVTTDKKGEITHFYGGSTTGHEYWLREFKGVNPNNTGGTRADNDVVSAKFEYPAAVSTNSKEVTNTFLWDYYYYEKTDPHQKDKNMDDYLKYKTYYKDKRTYEEYPFVSGAKAYILGLPGERYYEFDLSGVFNPTTTAETQPGRLNKQTITFASNTGAAIQVSDDEVVTAISSGYTFKPNYLNMAFKAGSDIYTLSAEGSSYDKVPSAPNLTENPEAAPVPDTELSAFRPFFKGANSSTRSIVFGNGDSDLNGDAEHGNPLDGSTGTLLIYAKKGMIVVESSLSYTEDVRVVTPAGVTVATFAVKSGQRVEVKADFSGMYVVHTEDGQYVKKVAVKRE